MEMETWIWSPTSTRSSASIETMGMRHLRSMEQHGINKPDSVAWGDYNGDGDEDVALGVKPGSNHRVFRNNGNGTMASVWNSAESESTSSVAWGDYDGDGRLDIAAGNNAQTNHIIRPPGSRPMRPPPRPVRDSARAR